MKQTQQQGPQIDLSKTLPIVCGSEECGNEVFMSVMKFRKIPKLLAGTTEDQIIPVQVFICTACGAIPKGFGLDI